VTRAQYSLRHGPGDSGEGRRGGRNFVARDRVAVGVHQLQHGAERGRRAVDLHPGLGAGLPREAVDIGIAGLRDRPVHSEAETLRVVAAGLVGSQGAQELGGGDGIVRVLAVDESLFELVDFLQIGIVAVRARWLRYSNRPGAAGVVPFRLSVLFCGLPAGSKPAPTDSSCSEVITTGCPGWPRIWTVPPDAVADILRCADGGHAGKGAEQLDDQALRAAALELQSAVRQLVFGDDRIFDHVDDVGVVPDRFGCQQAAADHHCR